MWVEFCSCIHVLWCAFVSVCAVSRLSLRVCSSRSLRLCSVSIPVVSITHITVIMKMSQRGARCRARSLRACHAHTALPLPIVRGAQVPGAVKCACSRRRAAQTAARHPAPVPARACFALSITHSTITKIQLSCYTCRVSPVTRLRAQMSTSRSPSRSSMIVSALLASGLRRGIACGGSFAARVVIAASLSSVSALHGSPLGM